MKMMLRYSYNRISVYMRQKYIYTYITLDADRKEFQSAIN